MATGPIVDAENSGIGIVHLGPGAFHRAHQATFTEDALAFSGDWRICGVQMRSTGVRDALAAQNYRYTLTILDRERTTRVIHAIAEVLVMPQELPTVLARMSAPTTHIVTMTITEKGYCLNPAAELDWKRPEILADCSTPWSPISAIGLLVEAIRLRRQEALPLTVISCDNLPNNGRLLRRAVTTFAGRQDPGLAAWVENNVAFPCTMVDSITPATDAELTRYVREETGFADQLPVSREAFAQWVIEDWFCGPRPAWHKVGVTFTDDVGAFEAAKIRLLNGAHSALAYAGMLVGHETVLDAMSDPALVGFVRTMMREEICPTLMPPAAFDLELYCEQILKRFRNPEIAYRLAQIAWDGSQKVRFRLFATIVDNLAAKRDCPRLIYAVAAWLHFVRRCFGRQESMTDSARNRLFAIAAMCGGQTEKDVELFLADAQLFPDELRVNPVFCSRLTDAYGLIESGGRHDQISWA